MRSLQCRNIVKGIDVALFAESRVRDSIDAEHEHVCIVFTLQDALASRWGTSPDQRRPGPGAARWPRRWLLTWWYSLRRSLGQWSIPRRWGPSHEFGPLGIPSRLRRTPFQPAELGSLERRPLEPNLLGRSLRLVVGDRWPMVFLCCTSVSIPASGITHHVHSTDLRSGVLARYDRAGTAVELLILLR